MCISIGDIACSKKCIGPYRYGFNGKEKDDEVSVGGGSYDFGARMYDSRLGRWLSLDPRSNDYPYFSPYGFAVDAPLIFIDPDGEKIVIHYLDSEGNSKYQDYTPGMSPEHSNEFVSQTIKALNSYHSSDSNIASSIVDKAHTSARTVEIHQTRWNMQSASNVQPEEIDGNNEVYYDPTEGIAMPNETAYPPGMILLIELDHAVEDMKYLEKIDNVIGELAKQGIEDIKSLKKNPDFQKALGERSDFQLNYREEEERNFGVEKQLSKELGYGAGPDADSYFDPSATMGMQGYTTPDVLSSERMGKPDSKEREDKFNNIRKNGQGN